MLLSIDNKLLSFRFTVELFPRLIFKEFFMSNQSQQLSQPVLSQVTLHPDISLTSVMGYQFDPLIHRMIDKHGWKIDKAMQAFDDLKRFLFLCGAGLDGPYCPSPVIDEWWHNFILFTEDYMLFCKKYFCRFIHHRPRRRGEKLSSRDLVLSTLNSARGVFGHLSENWNYVDGSGNVVDANTYKGLMVSEDCRQECKDCRTDGSCQDKDCHDS